MNKTPYNSVSDERLQQLGCWLREQGYSFEHLTPASTDAGFRRYFRLNYGERSLIAVDAPPKFEDCESFVDIAGKLSESNLTVPEILCYNLENGFMLLSDLGSVHLQDVVSPDDTMLAADYYEKATRMIIEMQQGTSTSGLPDYSAEHLQFELDLFPEWYLHRHLGIECDAELTKILQNCFKLCIDCIIEQPATFVHRDFHCRNLMIQSDNEIAIIDFQGAVIGPITYDIVSLLKDAYIEWPESFLSPLLEIHRKSVQALNGGRESVSENTYRRWLDYTGLQRHLKILGIFCRLHYRDGKSHYLDNIPLVCKHISTMAANYPELKQFHRAFCKLNTTHKTHN